MKGFILLAVALLLAQGGQSAELTGYYRDAQEALGELQVKAQSAVNSAVVELLKVNQEVAIVKSQVAANANAEIQKISDALKVEVTEVKNQVTGDTAWASQCFALYAEEINHLPTEGFTKIQQCLNNVEQHTVVEVKSHVAGVQGFLDVVEGFSTQVQSCTVSKDEVCVAKNFVDILLETITVHSKVAELSRTAQNSIETLTFAETLPSCLKDRLPSVQSQADLILRFLKRCVELI